jgi:hypothetical protein
MKMVKVMATRKVQLYVSSDADVKLYQFLDSVEEEAPDKKGYLGNRVKEILRAWSELIDIYGERDTMALAMQLAAGKQPEARPVIEPDPEPEHTDTAPMKGKFKSIASKRNTRG